MRIRRVEANNRKRVFLVHTAEGRFEFPYSASLPSPSPEDPLDRVYVDPELAGEGFTYVLRSGEEGSLHVDHVLEFNDDPAYMGEMELHLLTLRVGELVEASGLGKREISRRLRTSPTQLYRLLDPTNYNKSMRQVLALLHLLGYEVKFDVRKRETEVSA